MEVYIVGEDDLTKSIIQKILFYCSADYNIISELPARGGQIKSLIANFNKLSISNPVIMLTDLDNYDCPPTLLANWFQDDPKNPEFLIRVAIDEAEAWLMSDKKGFADYFKIPVNRIPGLKIHKRKRVFYRELDFPYKSSFYMMREIIPYSSDAQVKAGIIHKDGLSKGPTYNFTILPFLNHWNIKDAMKNSLSLERTVKSLKEFAK